jgi:aerobic carbon-monoxide dehydrogenase medium subunit
VQAAIPALAYLASVIGDPAVRHRGTLGGSLANNDPAADYPAAVLALGATVKTNKRSIKADDFFKGLFATALQDDEIITAVSFPIPAQAGYSKFPHPASRFALTGVFVTMTKSGDVRAAATGASQSGVMRLPAIEAALKANWSAAALDNVAIATAGLISDIHGSADYRANLIKVMAQRAVAAPGRANAGTATPIASPAVASPRVIGTAEQSAAQTPRSPLRRLLSGLIGKPGG